MPSRKQQVDGFLARRFNMRTVLGTILDPAADKALMTTLTVTLAFKGMLPSTSAHPLVPSPITNRYPSVQTSVVSDHHHRTRCAPQPLRVLHPLYLPTPSSKRRHSTWEHTIDPVRVTCRKLGVVIGIFRSLLRKCVRRPSARWGRFPFQGVSSGMPYFRFSSSTTLLRSLR